MFKHFVTLAGFIFSMSANAVFTISDVSYTASSVTFTIDGDMSGYSTPDVSSQFSLVYKGDIWSAPIDSGSVGNHSFSGLLFDNIAVEGGFTGSWLGSEYSWSRRAGFADLSLESAVATLNTVTMNMSADILDVNASNPIIEFYWGNGQLATFNSTLISSVNLSPVPVPAAAWLFFSAIASLVAVKRKS